MAGQYQTENYAEQGGARWIVGGELVVTGTLDMSGGTLVPTAHGMDVTGTLDLTGGTVIETATTHTTVLGQEIPNGVTFTNGAETANVIIVSMQLLAATGVNLANRGHVTGYLATDATGDVVATAPDGTVVGGANGITFQPIAKTFFHFISEANGTIDLSLGESTAKSFFLVILLPSGARVVSPAITFA